MPYNGKTYTGNVEVYPNRSSGSAGSLAVVFYMRNRQINDTSQCSAYNGNLISDIVYPTLHPIQLGFVNARGNPACLI